MVTGVTVLVEVIGKTGGLALFTDLLARLSGPTYVTGAIALGRASSQSTAARRACAADFLPTIPASFLQAQRRQPADDRLLDQRRLPPGRRLAAVHAGRLCLAVAAPHEDRIALFLKLLAWAGRWRWSAPSSASSSSATAERLG
jgi:hypothetical protein